MTIAKIVDSYFSLLLEPHFTVGPDGRETFHAYGLFGRGHVVPDAATGARLRHALKWTYAIDVIIIGLLSGTLGTMFGIGLGSIILILLVVPLHFAIAHRQTKGLDVSGQRLTVSAMQQNQAAKFGKRTLWMLSALGLGMASLSAAMAWAPWSAELADPYTRGVLLFGALLFGASAVSSGLSAMRHRQP